MKLNNYSEDWNVALGGHKMAITSSLLETISQVCGDQLRTNKAQLVFGLFIFGVIVLKIRGYYESMGLFLNYSIKSISKGSLFWVIMGFLLFHWSMEYFWRKNRVPSFQRIFYFIFNYFHLFYGLCLDGLSFFLLEEGWSFQFARTVEPTWNGKSVEWADGALDQENFTPRQRIYRLLISELLSRRPAVPGGLEEARWKQEVYEVWENFGDHGLRGGMEVQHKGRNRHRKGFGDARKFGVGQEENYAKVGGAEVEDEDSWPVWNRRMKGLEEAIEAKMSAEDLTLMMKVYFCGDVRWACEGVEFVSSRA